MFATLRLNLERPRILLTSLGIILSCGVVCTADSSLDYWARLLAFVALISTNWGYFTPKKPETSINMAYSHN